MDGLTSQNVMPGDGEGLYRPGKGTSKKMVLEFLPESRKRGNG